jgi:hypothetical protein
MVFEVNDDRSIAHSFLSSLRWPSNGYAVGTFANVAQSSMPTTRTRLTSVVMCYDIGSFGGLWPGRSCCKVGSPIRSDNIKLLTARRYFVANCSRDRILKQNRRDDDEGQNPALDPVPEFSGHFDKLVAAVYPRHQHRNPWN